METLIKSSASASCEEHINLRADTVTVIQGQTFTDRSTAGSHLMALYFFDEGLVWCKTTCAESGNLLDRFCCSVKDPASLAFLVPGILGSGA